MALRVSASDAKNNFGGLLAQVAELGRVDIVKHGRLVAVVLAPRLVEAALSLPAATDPDEAARHLIPPEAARAARMVRAPAGFDEP
ncbi:MAG: type II toxin-antitoxin system prevent-host-death family antitoxin [Polyangiaceae bacterium]|nr:type II toxin-antitoxin system prevent-host-death family antitoxin [Polyangiaceae bacterium]